MRGRMVMGVVLMRQRESECLDGIEEHIPN